MKILVRISNALILSICFVCIAKAYVIQDQKKAFSYNNVARASGHSYKSDTVKKNKDTEPVDLEIDYAEIADKVVINPEPFPNINMEDKDSLKIKMKSGQSVRIELLEQEGSSWKYDIPKDALSIVSSEYKDNIRIFELQATTAGSYQVFFDNYITKDGKIEVIQSKFIRFNIKDK